MSTTQNKISTPSGLHSAEEIRKEIYSQEVKRYFQEVADQLRLINLDRNSSRSFNTFSKTKLRSFMKNPQANEDNLRQLSQFLYRMCYPYRRLVWYQASMFDANAVSIIPSIDFSKTVNVKKVRKNYISTAKKIQQMALDQCILPMLLTAWREDTAFGYIYDDDNTMFIHVLNGKYCKVSCVDGGALRYAFDFSYFNTHADDLNYWADEFKEKFDLYSSGKASKWQELDYSREICLKVNIDDPTLSYPPFAPLFEQIIDNVDLQSIQNVKDQLSIYKLLVARLKPLTGTNMPDDFEVDLDTAIKYYDKLRDSLPPEVASVISPLPIESIEFKPTSTNDVDSVSNSTNNLFKNSGGSQILNNEKSGTNIVLAQIQMDTQSALKAILPQLQAWCNIYLTQHLGKDVCHVKYFDVSPYTRAEKKKELINSAQYGVPTKLAVAALDGFTPLETLSLEYVENDIFKLHETWIPLQSSYTRSGSSTGGAPTKDADELSDAGEQSREYR